MRKTYEKFEDLPNLGGDTADKISKVTINKEDLYVLKEIFKDFFQSADTQAYWRFNKLGDLNQIPVYEGRNSKHKATVYWK